MTSLRAPFGKQCAAVSAASPSLPGGSSCEPARNAIRNVTSGEPRLALEPVAAWRAGRDCSPRRALRCARHVSCLLAISSADSPSPLVALGAWRSARGLRRRRAAASFSLSSVTTVRFVGREELLRHALHVLRRDLLVRFVHLIQATRGSPVNSRNAPSARATAFVESSDVANP